jgi:hypothetical protein
VRCAGYFVWTSITYRLVVSKPVLERPLGASNHRWENYVKTKDKDRRHLNVDEFV